MHSSSPRLAAWLGAFLAIVLAFQTQPLPGATREPVHAHRAMVVSTEAHATMTGVEVLRRGGNAVDAAIAIGFLLSVTHPEAGALGGGGFMLIRFADGRSTFLDYRERAPAAASREMYLDEAGNPTDESVVGYRAVAVPGAGRGYELAWKKYGSLPWAELVQPAVELARNGFSLTYGKAESLKASDRLPLFPESKRIFLNNGRPFSMGDPFRQPDLAAALKRIAKNGADELYNGLTAQRLVEDMQRHGGLFTLEDLQQYRAVERKPLGGTYRGFGILSAPPPSSGGAGIVQMLNMLEGTDYPASGPGSAAAIHMVAETMRRFFADRAEYFGDTDFVDVPMERLLSKDYARRRWESIDDRASSSEQIRAGEILSDESGETTHYSVVDPQGNAVAVTYTLNGSYGSGVTAAGTGILLNNEMDDFTAKPGKPNSFGLLQSEKNSIEPGKRPLSAMTPTIVTRDGKPFLILGSPGGPKIISTVLQIITNVIDFKMDLQQAVDFPRFHHQWMPDELRLEDYGFSPDTIALLKQRGHKVAFSKEIGRAMAIQVGEGWVLGAADSRTEGVAAGF